jgi:uroporphyrinogen-III decarboxylase
MIDKSTKLQERSQRFFNTVALKKTDRIPIIPMCDSFPIRYYGASMKEAVNNPGLLSELWLRYHEEFDPDMGDVPHGVLGFFPIAEALGFNLLKWAGHGLSDNSDYQYVEREMMPPDDYDRFIFDPSDFMLRKMLPQMYDKLAPLAKLPTLESHFYFMNMFDWVTFADPAFIETAQAMAEAGRQAAACLGFLGDYAKALVEVGYPPSIGAMTVAPFDCLGDLMRGMKGILTDIRRRPEKVIAMCEKILPIMAEQAIKLSAASGMPVCFIPMHKHVDSLMSQEQFLKFYWPTLKELINTLVAHDIIPYLVVEGVADQRLPVMINEVPEGKVIFHLEGSDIFKAKELARGKVCLRGNIPASVMILGKPDEVKSYCKKLIDVVGADGGFIMDVATSLADAKPDNVKALFNYTREYGAY